MTFAQFKNMFQSHLDQMTRGVGRLYEVNVDKDALWNLYLDSFPADANVIFRKRREFDCSCCRSFVRTFGNVVAIRDGHVVSVWDFKTGDAKYQPVLDALSAFVKQHRITDVHFTKTGTIGTDHSMENDDGKIVRWDHFSAQLPVRFIYSGRMSEGEYKGRCRDVRNVFKRSLDEISMDAVDVVLELINSNSLYRGQEWFAQLNTFKKYKKTYDAIGHTELKEIFAWDKADEAGEVVGKIRNHSIGVLLTDISDGMDLDQAVRRYENIVAPSNYKRPKAIFTKKMLEDAQKKIEGLGFMPSLPRRHARLNDISVNNILFCNRDVSSQVQGGDVFAQMMADTTKKAKSFERIEEIGIEDFVKNVLPSAQNVEVYLENRHAKNLVSLIAPVNGTAPYMFKWNNPFSWAYTGNVTDSLKENVAKAGGKVDGDLRFSIQWNDDEYNPNDFDAHCQMPNGQHISFRQKFVSPSCGKLDVDIVTPREGTPAVENITWPTRSSMPYGTYDFYVECFSNNGGRSGFKAEIEFDGQIFSFEYPNELRHKERVNVATVTLDRDGKFSIKPRLLAATSSKEMWGVKTNDFIPVSIVMYSPNYWDGQQGVGHRHVFFMLSGCKNTESPNGFYNEFLREELLEHKRVFEALGGRMKVEDTDDQLSGVGFSTTKRDEVIVRVTGAAKRLIKVKF